MVDYELSSEKTRYKCQVTKPLSNGLWDTKGRDAHLVCGYSMASKAIWYDYVTISSVSKVSNLAGEQLHTDTSTADDAESRDKTVVSFRDAEDDRMKYYLFEDEHKARQLFDFIVDKQM